MKKFFLISITAILLIVVCGPFVPPIYNRYTKPLWRNYMAGKEWYSKVNHESMEEVRDSSFGFRFYVLNKQNYYMLTHIALKGRNNPSPG